MNIKPQITYNCRFQQVGQVGLLETTRLLTNSLQLVASMSRQIDNLLLKEEELHSFNRQPQENL